MLRLLGNIIWFIFGGFINALGWTLVGLVWCLTLIGIPIGRQCFKIARLTAFPFGKDIEIEPGGPSIFLNILWILFGGFELALLHLSSGILLALTIIGLPFAKQQFKLMKLALFPFGARIVGSRSQRVAY